MRIRIAVCEDDEALGHDLAAWIAGRQPEAMVQVFRSAEDLLRAEPFPLYFLDIKGVSGLAAAREIRRREAPGARRGIIVFVTGYREYMEEAFDVQAFHYLVKPVDVEKLARVLTRAVAEAAVEAEWAERYLLLKTKSGQEKVFLRDIAYIESNNKRVTVHTVTGAFETPGKMDDFERLLGSSFYRCHRCYLVNFARVAAYRAGEIQVTTGDRVLLSQRKYPGFVRAFLRYAKEGGLVHV